MELKPFDGKKGSLGIEEEIWLVDGKNRLVPKAIEVLALAARERGINIDHWKKVLKRKAILRDDDPALFELKQKAGLQGDLPASQAEITTGVHMDIGSLMYDLVTKRMQLSNLCYKLGIALSYEPAPEVSESDLHIFPKERYVKIHEERGSGVLDGFLAAMQVHYGLSDQEQVLPVLNHLSSTLLDDFQSFYSHKRIKKYAKVVGEDNLVCPYVNNWQEYEDVLDRMGALEDPSFCWHLLRFHSEYNTIELRIPDVQASRWQAEWVVDTFVKKVEEVI